jgi:hypothetical protein
LAERALEGGRELGFFGQRAKEARVDDRVHGLRKLSEAVGESWRGAEHERDQGDQIGILSQQRKQPPAAVQSGKEPVECHDRRIRVCQAGKMLKQHRHDFGELAAREFTLERAVASRVPAPHQGGGLERAPKAHFGQSVEGFAIVRLGWKTQCPATGLDYGRILEQRRIVALHIAQMNEQGVRKGVSVGEAGEAGKTFEPVAIGRQGVDLLVGHHLEAVFDHT